MLLINPAISAKIQPWSLRQFMYCTFPISIGYLASYLREECRDDVRIVDEQIEFLDEDTLAREMEGINGPKIVGITCLTGTASRTFELAKMIRKIDPRMLIVLGGIHPTALPVESLQASGADIVVKGEGEMTLGEIYRSIRDGGSYKEIRGIAYLNGGEVVHTMPRELIPDLSVLPKFPYDLFEANLAHYRDFGTIISSRGCPFNCIFCSQRLISGQQYRYLPTERVIEQLELLTGRYNQKKIWFMDDTFTINKRRAFELLDAIIEKGYHKKASFITCSRGKEMNWEILTRMKEANFILISFGVETASERLMAGINKKEKVQDNIDAIKLTHKAGIMTDASFIMGLPGETREDRELSSRLSLELPLDGVRFYLAMPYPGTRLYEIAKEEGRLNVTEDWNNCSNRHHYLSNSVPYTPVGTTNIELIHDTVMANLRFHFRLKVLLQTLTSSLFEGGMLSIPKKWYFMPKLVFSFIIFGILLVKRVASLKTRLFFQRLFK